MLPVINVNMNGESSVGLVVHCISGGGTDGRELLLAINPSLVAIPHGREML